MVNICEWELENQLQFASIVVNGLVAAGTIAAVVVAICANKQTKKALCQSKNIELLDKRIDILEKIKNDEFEKHLKIVIFFIFLYGVLIALY